MILQRVIPKLYPSCPLEDIPFDVDDSNFLDIFNVVKLAICAFDKEIISSAVQNSYKIAKVPVNRTKDKKVPTEGKQGFRITGQWHLTRSGDDGGTIHTVNIAT